VSEIAPSTVAQASVSGAPLNYNLRARTAATAAFMEGETWPLSEKLNATFHRENDDSLINQWIWGYPIFRQTYMKMSLHNYLCRVFHLSSHSKFMVSVISQPTKFRTVHPWTILSIFYHQTTPSCFPGLLHFLQFQHCLYGETFLC